jgi:hypothetical protein
MPYKVLGLPAALADFSILDLGVQDGGFGTITSVAPPWEKKVGINAVVVQVWAY